MLTPDQIKSKEFHTTGKSSYKAEEVDEFLNEIHASYDQMFRENANIIKKMSILANKVEEYKKDEDSLRQALLSAQKLADRIVSEAKETSEKQLSEASQQAEGMLSDASQKAEKILDEAKRTAEAKVHEANKQADEIIGGVNRKVTQEKLVLEMLKKEVAAFRTKMMDMYKEHLTLLDRLPTYSEETKEEEPQDVEPETAQEAVEAPVEEADEVEEVTEAVEPVEDTVEEEAEEAVEETAEETVEEPVEDDTFELTDIENILDDVDVGLRQLQPALPGLAGKTRGDDDDVGARRGVIVAGADDRRGTERRALINVHRLAERLLLVDVDQDDLGRGTLDHQVVCDRGADAACADNSDLTHNA